MTATMETTETPVLATLPTGDHTADPMGEMEDGFGVLDRGFGHAVAVGYAIGFVVIGVLMVVILSVQTDMPFGAVIGASLGVAFWIGVMGGTVAVGLWSGRHEKELFGH